MLKERRFQGRLGPTSYFYATYTCLEKGETGLETGPKTSSRLPHAPGSVIAITCDAVRGLDEAGYKIVMRHVHLTVSQCRMAGVLPWKLLPAAGIMGRLAQ